MDSIQFNINEDGVSASGKDQLSGFARSLFAIIPLIIIVSTAIGWLFYKHNLDNLLSVVADEADAVLTVSSSYVSLYSELLSQTDANHLPVPAEFRALASESINNDYSGDEHFRTMMVGMPNRYIRTAASDEQMRSALKSLALEVTNQGKAHSHSTIVEINDRSMLRTLYPSFASQQSCVDCHNKIQQPVTKWKLGDMMGAYVIERGIGETQKRYAFFAMLLSMLTTLLIFSAVVVFNQQSNLKKQSASLKLAAETDPLTGCLNRRSLSARIEALDAEKQLNAALLVLDIDHFKSINDNYGHEAGDTVLVEFANAIRSSLRKEDIFARTGGEEFLLYMPNTPEKAAKEIADRIRVRISKLRTVHHHIEMSITVSIGAVHTSHAPSQRLELYSRIADNFLYQAKEMGRDRVVWANTST